MFLSMLMASLLLGACGAKENPSVTITIGDRGFYPANLNIKFNTQVVWVNADYNSNHRIKSVLFNSPELVYAQKFTHVFEAKGTYEYSCGIHSNEVGKIVVE